MNTYQSKTKSTMKAKLSPIHGYFCTLALLSIWALNFQAACDEGDFQRAANSRIAHHTTSDGVTHFTVLGSR
tara:strand:+ start:856 stop:1071 length:216 start_codon:yes stop_codon:yes gene_type:complete